MEEPMTKGEKNRFIDLWHRIHTKNRPDDDLILFYKEFMLKGYSWDYMNVENTIVGVWKDTTEKEYMELGQNDRFIFSFTTNLKKD